MSEKSTITHTTTKHNLEFRFNTVNSQSCESNESDSDQSEHSQNHANHML